MRVIRMNPKTGNSSFIGITLDEDVLLSVLAAPGFSALVSRPTGLPGVLMVSADRENENFPLHRIACNGFEAEGDTLFVRYDPVTGAPLNADEETLASLAPLLTRLDPPARTKGMGMRVGVAFKDLPIYVECRTVGPELFAKSFPLAGQEDIALQPCVIPWRCHQLVVHRSRVEDEKGTWLIEAAEQPDREEEDSAITTLSVYQMDAGVLKDRFSARIRSGLLPISGVNLLEWASHKNSDFEILGSPLERPVVTEDGRQLCAGITPGDIATWKEKCRLADADNTFLDFLTICAEGGMKGAWAEITTDEQVDVFKRNGFPEDEGAFAPAVKDARWFSLMDQGRPRALIALPDPVTPDWRSWPNEGRLFTTNSIDDVWSYREALKGLLVFAGLSNARAADILDDMIASSDNEDAFSLDGDDSYDGIFGQP